MTKKTQETQMKVAEQVVGQVAGEQVEQAGVGLELYKVLVQELNLLEQYRHELKKKLTEGVDYGTPYPNAQRLQLLKPGADKIRYLLQIEVTSEESTPIIQGGKIIGYQVKLVMFSKRLRQQNIVTRLCLQSEPGKANMRLDTLLAIARKRAFVYGIVELAGLSDLFVDELDEAIEQQQTAQQNIQPQTQQQQAQQKKVIEITAEQQQGQQLSEEQLKSYAKTFWLLLTKKAKEKGIELKSEHEKQELKRVLLQYLFLDTPIESLKELTKEQWREVWKTLKEENQELQEIFEIYKSQIDEKEQGY
jgi:hypothetical protein